MDLIKGQKESILSRLREENSTQKKNQVYFQEYLSFRSNLCLVCPVKGVNWRPKIAHSQPSKERNFNNFFIHGESEFDDIIQPILLFLRKCQGLHGFPSQVEVSLSVDLGKWVTLQIQTFWRNSLIWLTSTLEWSGGGDPPWIQKTPKMPAILPHCPLYRPVPF